MASHERKTKENREAAIHVLNVGTPKHVVRKVGQLPQPASL